MRAFFDKNGYVHLNTEERNDYEAILKDLGISLNSQFAAFNLATIRPTFYNRGYELYNVCWFTKYSDNLKYATDSARDDLGLPEEYLPLDSFEAESGFFYNRKTGEVLQLELGDMLMEFQSGNLRPQWKDFNTFLE